MFNEKIFWRDGVDGDCRGGIFTRAAAGLLLLELYKFINK